MREVNVELPARYIPFAYSYIMLGTFVGAILSSPEATVWPAAVKSSYPSRPSYQIGAACALLPHALTIFLWCWKTRCWIVYIAGATKFTLSTLSNYITRADSVKLSGSLAFLDSLAAIFWMYASQKRCKGKARKIRLYVMSIYIAIFVIGSHLLGRQLQSGFGQEAFRTLRAIGYSVDVGHEYLGKYEFAGVVFTIEWVQSIVA